MATNHSRAHPEPKHLHTHSNLRLGTLFREHTTLGETFETALRNVIGHDHPDLLQELRVQFGVSIDAVCEEMEQSDAQRVESRARSNVTGRSRKRRKIGMPAAQLTSTISESSGLRGTFHYQTDESSQLNTPLDAPEWNLPLSAEERRAVQQGLTLAHVRGMDTTKISQYDLLEKNEVLNVLNKEKQRVGATTMNKNSTGRRRKKKLNVKRATRTMLLHHAVDMHNDRIAVIQEHGYVENLGPMDIWCAKA